MKCCPLDPAITAGQICIIFFYVHNSPNEAFTEIVIGRVARKIGEFGKI